MSTRKRPASPYDAADTHFTKKSHTAEHDPVPEQASFTLEFLPENRLPHRQELTQLNELIHSEMTIHFQNPTLQLYDVSLILVILDKHCDFLDAGPHCWPSLGGDKQATVNQFLQMAQDAFQRGDYGDLMLIKGLQRLPQPAPVLYSYRTFPPSGIPHYVYEGWDAPFIGTAHITLAQNLQKMFQTSRVNSCHLRSMTHATMIQSSGSGKSRLIDKVAETIFTIPFNIREERDAESGAWPHADDKIRDLLVRWTCGGKTYLHARYLCFFTAVFEEVTKEVKKYMLQQPSLESTASAWRAHLRDNESEKRNVLYEKVVNSDTIRYGHSMPFDVDSATVRALRKTAKSALKRLLAAVCPQTTCDVSHADKTYSSPVKTLHVLIYFDEAHVLADRLHSTGTSRCEFGTTALDVLFPLLDEFRDRGLFAVFISTQSHLEHLESMTSPVPFVSPPLVARPPPYAHAPITETIFDCFGDRPIVPSRLRADDVCDAAFMACFGRPLWRSLLLPFCDEVLASATGTPQDPSPNPESDDRSWRCQEVIHLAQRKLVFDLDLCRDREDVCEAAQTAVLDVRIMLPFNPRSSVAYSLQMELVASHIRTIYSVPQHREYVQSGYPSEPILAEAAASQLHIWRNPDREDEPRGFTNVTDPAVSILRSNVNEGLLDRGEIGGAVGRLLLTLARDRAGLLSLPETKRRIFSRAVPVNIFIKALFAPDVAQRVLDSKPDNWPEGQAVTFAEAFENAVLNFTHFARWDDGAVPGEGAAVGCFVRSMAVVCRHNTSKVDAFIPVLLDKSAHLRPQVMTGMLVRINCKQRKTAVHTIGEEDVGLFDPALSEGRTAPRPYITLAMELGSPADDAPINVGQPPIRASDRVETVQHPRYSVTAYGCSPSAYQVIGKKESGPFKLILRQAHPLQDHGRQDTDSLDLVRMLKPQFSTADASWSWIANDADGPSMDDIQEEPSLVERDAQ